MPPAIKKIRDRWIVDDACWVVRHAWSFRLLALAAVMTGLEALVPLFGEKLPGPDWARALLILFVVGGAMVARVMTQRKFGAS